MKPELPPPNRAIGWYRFVLWIMPTCVAVTTALGIGLLADHFSINDQLPLLVWFFLNLAVAGGIGALDWQLRVRLSGVDDGIEAGWWVARFIALQLIIVPAVAFAVVLGFCLISGPFI